MEVGMELLFFAVGAAPKNVEGVVQESVEIRVRLSAPALERLRASSVPCSCVWLTEQPDGSFALGVTTRVPPQELGFEARAVERDDRAERFGRGPRGPS